MRGDTAERAVAPRVMDGVGVGEAEGGLRGAGGFGETVVIYLAANECGSRGDEELNETKKRMMCQRTAVLEGYFSHHLHLLPCSCHIHADHHVQHFRQLSSLSRHSRRNTLRGLPFPFLQ